MIKKLLLLFIVVFAPALAFAQAVNIPQISLGMKSTNNPQEVVDTIKIILMLTVLTLAPAILILMTCFTRIIVIFSFLRQALGTQQMPPNQLLIGLSLFLTFFIMKPAFTQINQEALKPYILQKYMSLIVFISTANGKISQIECFVLISY